MTSHCRKLALLTALMLVAAPALAQSDHHRGPHGSGPDTGMHEQALSRLDLSDEQRASIDRLTADHQVAVRDLVERQRKARQALAEQMRATEFDESAIRAAVFSAAQAEADLAVEQARMHQEIRALLTDEQRERMNEILERRQNFMQHGRGFHEGRPVRPMEPATPEEN